MVLVKVDGSVLAKLARAWLADPKGCALLASWAGVFGCVTLRAFSLRRQARLLQAPPEKKPPSPKAAGGASPVKALVKRAIPGWRSKPAAWGCLLSVGIGLRLIVNTKLNTPPLLKFQKVDAEEPGCVGGLLVGSPVLLFNNSNWSTGGHGK